MTLQLAQGRVLHLSSDQPLRLHVVGTAASWMLVGIEALIFEAATQQVRLTHGGSDVCWKILPGGEPKALDFCSQVMSAFVSAITTEADLPPPDADSVWSPPAAALEGLPYGGCLQTAVEKDDRNAVRSIQRQWGMHEDVILPSDAEIDASARAVEQGPLPPSREASGAPAPRRSASESAAADMGLTREEARQFLQEHLLAREGFPSPGT